MHTATDNSTAQMSSTLQYFTGADWLDLHFAAMQPECEAMVRWVGIEPGWCVLDAAAGSGSLLPLLTELVGPHGAVSAIDLAPEKVAEIEERVRQANWSAPVEARTGSVTALPYVSGTFDAVWCANVTEYLTDDELRQMLAEFRRVVRPGGLVAIKEWDNTGQLLLPGPPLLLTHLDEAALRAGDTWAHGLFRVAAIPQWLRAAGFRAIRQKPTLVLRFQPLRPVERRFICNMVRALTVQAEAVDLPADELAAWRKLAETDAEDHIVNDPDFQFRVVQTVFVGQVP